jgi:glutamine synthetase
MYTRELLISNAQNGNLLYREDSPAGYTDIRADIDLSTFRRIPWENDIPFFYVRFLAFLSC